MTVLGILRFLIGDGGKERAAWKVCDLLGIGLQWELLAFGLVFEGFHRVQGSFGICALFAMLRVASSLCVAPATALGGIFCTFCMFDMGMIALVLALSVPYLGSRSSTN